MTVTVYRSSDGSAPTLTGQVGSLIGILDACLINGYGAKSAAGWAKEFSGTNLAVYRAASGRRFRFRVDDTSAQEARVSGYESMSGVSTGTNQFPTNAQLSGGLFVRKSETADATARGWVVVATEVAFYFLPSTNLSDWLTAPTGSFVGGQMFFGDFPSFVTSDAYNTAIIAAHATGGTNCPMCRNEQNGVSAFTAMTGHYMARAYTQTGTSITASKAAILDSWLNITPGAASAVYPPYPDPVTGGILVSPFVLCESGASGHLVRGYLPGLWAPLHSAPANHADTFSGSGDTSGKTFQLFNSANLGSLGRLAIETSNTW